MRSKCPNLCFLSSQEFIQPYISSITSMDTEHVLEAAKDAGGARVVEAFLGSNASAKQKHRLVVKYVTLCLFVFLSSRFSCLCCLKSFCM